MEVLVRCMAHDNPVEGCYYLAGLQEGRGVAAQTLNNVSDVIHIGLWIILILLVLNIIQFWKGRQWVHY
jgi:hypothetical protein